MDEIIEEFLVESYENLDRLDLELVELEEHPDSPELIASIFRNVHTIKGTAGFFEYANLEAVAHSGESLLSRLRDGELRSNSTITSAKVVKYANHITKTVEERQALERGIIDMLAIVEQLGGSSSQLSAVSEEMGASAEESAAQANVVAAAAEEVSAKVSTVASATEQMTASIREIAANSANAASVAGRAVEVAHDTNSTAAKLGESSAEIGQIVKVITSIA